MKGFGFSQSTGVAVGSDRCAVVYASDTELRCRTPAVSDHAAKRRLLGRNVSLQQPALRSYTSALMSTVCHVERRVDSIPESYMRSENLSFAIKL